MVEEGKVQKAEEVQVVSKTLDSNFLRAQQTTHLPQNVRISVYHELHNDQQLPWLEIGDLRNVWHDYRLLDRIWKGYQDAHFSWQCVAIFIGGYLCHSVAFYGPRLGGFFAYGICLTLLSAIAPHLSAASGVGVFTGLAGRVAIPNQGYLTVLMLVACFVWWLMIKFKVLLGVGGRLGGCVFVTMLLLHSIVLMPAGVVPWSLYTGGGATYSEAVPWQKAVIFIISSPVTSVICLYSRNLGGLLLNPVASSSMVALFLMLIVSAASLSAPQPWPYYNDVMEGISVGSFVGMSGLSVLPTTFDFFLTSLFAIGYTMLLSPFLEGFVTLGFEAVMGLVTLHLIRLAASKLGVGHRDGMHFFKIPDGIWNKES